MTQDTFPCPKCGAMVGHTLSCVNQNRPVVKNDRAVVMEAMIEGVRREKAKKE